MSLTSHPHPLHSSTLTHTKGLVGPRQPALSAPTVFLNLSISMLNMAGRHCAFVPINSALPLMSGGGSRHWSLALSGWLVGHATHWQIMETCSECSLRWYLSLTAIYKQSELFPKPSRGMIWSAAGRRPLAQRPQGQFRCYEGGRYILLSS